MFLSFVNGANKISTVNVDLIRCIDSHSLEDFYTIFMEDDHFAISEDQYYEFLKFINDPLLATTNNFITSKACGILEVDNAN